MAKALRERMGAAGRYIPIRTLPDWVVKLVGKFDAAVSQIVPELGKYKNATNAKARRDLWRDQERGTSPE